MKVCILACLLLAACAPPEEPPPEPVEPGRWEVSAPWAPQDPHPCPVDIDTDDDLVSELLGELSLDRSIGIPQSMYTSFGGNLASDPTRLDFFHRLQEDFSSVPCHAGNMAGRTDALLDSDHPLAGLVADGAVQLDVAVDAGGPWPALEGDPLIAALDRLHGNDDWDGRDDAIDGADDVPQPVKEAAAHVLLGAEEAADLREQALDFMGEDQYRQTYFRDGANNLLVSESNGVNPDWDGAAGMFVGNDEGSGRLYTGGVRLAQAIDEADWAAAAGTGGDFSFFAETPLGSVVLRGTADDEYDAALDPALGDELLLLVDTGGDDVIRIPAGATTSEDHAISVHVDLGGGDFYGYPEVPSDLDEEGLLPSDAAGRHTPDSYYGPYARSHVGRPPATASSSMRPAPTPTSSRTPAGTATTRSGSPMIPSMPPRWSTWAGSTATAARPGPGPTAPRTPSAERPAPDGQFFAFP